MSRRSYKDALKAFSARTGSPLSSLLVSFAVLHEITAVAPLVGIFYGAKALGVGERVVGSVVDGPTEGGYIREQCRTLVQEGEGWAERVGRRYGIWGFPQTPKGTKFEKDPLEQISSHIAGDVANAVFAYGATKALAPVRLGLSFYLSPAFSRAIVEPVRKGVMRLWQRTRS